MRRKKLKPAQLAKRARVDQGTLSKVLRRQVAPDPETLERLTRGLGYDFPVPSLARAEHFPTGQANAPGSLQDERSDGAAPVPTGEELLGVEAWKGMSREMQHNLAVQIIREALEAQDFAGSPVLRAMHGIAEKMAELGYTQMSRHIWAEMGKYFGKSIPPEQEP
jgi:transcriptional regulator with XRE-family HTH domain